MAIYIGSKNEQRRLPDAYEEVEYLVCDGNQYVDTLYVPNGYTCVNARVRMGSSYSKSGIFGVYNNNNWRLNSYGFYYPNYGVLPYTNYNSDFQFAFGNDPANAIVSIAINRGTSSFAVNDRGQGVLSQGDKVFTSPGNLWLMRLNGFPDYRFSGNWMKMEIFETNGSTVTPKRDFVPCRVKSGQTVTDAYGNVQTGGKLGLFDYVTKKLYTNKGTGDFLAGGLIENGVGPYKFIRGSQYKLPVQLQEVEYIESSGTQYIELDIAASGYEDFDIDFMPLSSSSTKSTILGTWYGNDKWEEIYYTNQNASLAWYPTNNNPLQSPYDAFKDLNVRHTVTVRKNYLTVDGNDLRISRVYSFYSRGKTFYVFALNDNSVANYFATARLYGINRYSLISDKLFAKFIPCYVRDGYTMEDINRHVHQAGTAGLYDPINGKFYTNSGTGSFTVGPDKPAEKPATFRVKL